MWGSSKNKSSLSWNHITEITQLNELEKLSFEKPILIFKHSTRCSISSMAKNRLELYWDQAAGIEPWYLDLLAYRAISDEIAKRTGENPKTLISRKRYAVQKLRKRLAVMRDDYLQD